MQSKMYDDFTTNWGSDGSYIFWDQGTQLTMGCWNLNLTFGPNANTGLVSTNLHKIDKRYL